MDLVSARIRQFRSIKDVIVQFDEDDCIVLLGINETGKSNILRALALLSRTVKASPDDVRQVPHDEPVPAEAEVEFVLGTSPTDFADLTRAYAERTRGLGGELRLRAGTDLLDIEAFARAYASRLPYTVDIKTNQRALQYWKPKDNLVLDGAWLTPGPNCRPEHQIDLPGVGAVPLQSVPFIEASKRTPDVSEDLLRPATADDVQELFFGVILQICARRIPECVAWSFTKDAVLPSSVILDEFTRDPRSAPALLNMFQLAGYGDVADAIQTARKRANGVRMLLDRVSTIASKELKALWTDKNLSLVLAENGQKLDCAIQDVHGVFDFERRSDGFRRFASFMLMVSTRARAGNLDGAVLLYDEPDASLHPAAARQLRKELLGLSQRCKVVYSTHSVFMVDPTNVGRHLFVSRVNEETTVTRAKPGNVRDEEVLYQAIGHTIFADLREANLLVEGFRDRRLLDVALETPGAEPYRHALTAIGRCHTRGVKNIPAVTAMLDLIQRSYLILTDNDSVALQHRSNYKGQGQWLTYAELVGDTNVVTVEDFVRVDRILEAMAAAAFEFAELAEVPASLVEERGVMYQLEHALAVRKLDKARRHQILNAVKDHIFNGLMGVHLRPNAAVLVERLALAFGPKSEAPNG